MQVEKTPTRCPSDEVSRRVAVFESLVADYSMQARKERLIGLLIGYAKELALRLDAYEAAPVGDYARCTLDGLTVYVKLDADGALAEALVAGQDVGALLDEKLVPHLERQARRWYAACADEVARARRMERAAEGVA